MSRDWHGDASFGGPEGCAWGLAITVVLAAVVLAVLEAVGVL